MDMLNSKQQFWLISNSSKLVKISRASDKNFDQVNKVKAIIECYFYAGIYLQDRTDKQWNYIFGYDE